jgi:hypothetical protein
MMKKANKIHKRGGRYFKIIREGDGYYDGLFLWQPMKKILLFYIPDRPALRLWLYEFGFVKV